MRPMQSAPVNPAMARATSNQLMSELTDLFLACTCSEEREVVWNND